MERKMRSTSLPPGIRISLSNQFTHSPSPHALGAAVVFTQMRTCLAFLLSSTAKIVLEAVRSEQRGIDACFEYPTPRRQIRLA
jgi:hypothetical protein